MAVTFYTDYPASLLSKFDAAITQTEAKGKITTWQESANGNYYTHKAAEWAQKAWFKPRESTRKLVFNIIKPKGVTVTKVVYAYYHGHLIETFLTHFDADFTTATASALPEAEDKCR